MNAIDRDDTAQKIAEIRKSAEEARKTDRSWVDGQDYADDVEFLLDELEQITEQIDELLDEKAEWQVVAGRGWHVAGEETKKNESLRKERDRLIKVLQWYASDQPMVLYAVTRMEELEEALREIDTHIRSTPEPVQYIVETLKRVLPEYQEGVTVE